MTSCWQWQLNLKKHTLSTISCRCPAGQRPGHALLWLSINPTKGTPLIHPILPLYGGLFMAQQQANPRHLSEVKQSPEKWPVGWADTPRRLLRCMDKKKKRCKRLCFHSSHDLKANIVRHVRRGCKSVSFGDTRAPPRAGLSPSTFGLSDDRDLPI